MFLFKSTKLRRKLLAYSFSHVENDHYVRELAGLIDEDPGNLSRELHVLEKEGLYSSSVRGRNKLYKLNKEYPLFSDLKSIIAKTEGVEGQLRGMIAGLNGVSAAFIHGSYAKDKEHALSDIDLVVAGRVSGRELTGKISALEKQLTREINFTLYTDEEFATEKAKKGGFLGIVLKGKIIVLKGQPI